MQHYKRGDKGFVGVPNREDMAPCKGGGIEGLHVVSYKVEDTRWDENDDVEAAARPV